MNTKKVFTFSLICCTLHATSTENRKNPFEDKQMFDDSVHAFDTLRKNVGDPLIKVSLPYTYLYSSGTRSYEQVPVAALAAYGAYAAYEEFKNLSGMQPALPLLNENSYPKNSVKHRAAWLLNQCIAGTNYCIDYAVPLIAVFILKTCGKGIDKL